MGHYFPRPLINHAVQLFIGGAAGDPGQCQRGHYGHDFGQVDAGKHTSLDEAGLGAGGVAVVNVNGDDLGEEVHRLGALLPLAYPR